MKVFSAVACVFLSWQVGYAAQVLIKWDDTKNTTPPTLGYTIERKVDAGEYAQLSDAPGPEARSFVDEAPLKGKNCYVVYTRGATGPSGFSQESCIEVADAVVPPTQPPPSAGQVSVQMTLGLTCTGTYETGTPVKMVLNCTAP